MLSGSGTAGAYHAGVLHALQEAGVKIDLVAGRGMGAVSSMFVAVDGAGHLWDESGPWNPRSAKRLYPWRGRLRIAVSTLAAALTLVVLPLSALVVGIVVYPVAFLLRLLGVEGGATLASAYGRLLDLVFDPAALPTLLPRLVVLTLVVLLATLLAGALVSLARARVRRRSRGAVWWQVLGTPLDSSGVSSRFVNALWQLIRGAAPLPPPPTRDIAGRYSELLAENLGQPGFRELIVTAHDVDARRDLVFALLAEPFRANFFRTRTKLAARRQLELMDLAGSARELSVDALIGALSLPVVTEPHLITFAPESRWRGETHRLCDRPGALGRLLDEVANAGAEQVVLVSAMPEPVGPHTLSAGRRDGRGRVGEYLAAIEATAVRDGVGATLSRFRRIFQIHPSHNPLGPFDFAGVYDERSDRRQTLGELVDRGYEDAYLQFVDPVVGASGERLQRAQREK